jgi:hypothetical protein
MRRITICALVIVVLTSLCIGQREEFTLQEWKDHISFASPPSGQDPTSMISGVRNVDELPVGTHMVFEIESEGTSQGVNIGTNMTLGMTVSGREVVEGIHCTVLDIAMEMEMETQGVSMVLAVEGKEWVDETGTPVKVEEEVAMKFGEYEIPMQLNINRTGEELIYGHDCWVFTGTQTMEVMGIQGEESKVIEYMDKESKAIIQAITTIGEEEVDTGYIEPPIPVEDLQWELGGRESVTTPMGTYDCQIIYLKENEEVVGTIWATEDIRAPIKYVFSYETADMDLEMTMTLIEYTLGP